MNDETKAAAIIESDQWMMQCLRTAAKLNLYDWYIGAGFVRNKIWDVLHGYEQRTPLNDVDVVYFDREIADISHDKALEQQLHEMMPGVPWSVINLAHIHKRYDQKPFSDSTHAISFWPEIPTCVGVRLDLTDEKLAFTAPYGWREIFNLEVKPTTGNQVPLGVYQGRIAKKQWHKIWPKLQIEHG